MINMKRFVWLFLIMLMVLTGCGQYKRFTYLQPAIPERDTLYTPAFKQYKLQPADILHVRVMSIDKNVNELFNTDASSLNSSAMGGMATGGMYLSGHSIDSNGLIHLPVIGDVLVAGLTLEEATSKLQALAIDYIKDAHVEIKLVSFKISMLGEVNHPGQITIFNDKANILEALSLCGDLSYYGNRKNILIVRNVRGGLKTIKINLTDRALLKSDQYYLQPNDVLYVEPLRTTVFRLRVADYSVLLTLLTSTITAIFLITQATKK